MKFLERNGDLEVVAQHVQDREDVGPLHHLAQRTPLQHFGTEDVPGLLGQEAHVDEDLDSRGIKQKSRQEKRREEKRREEKRREEKRREEKSGA